MRTASRGAWVRAAALVLLLVAGVVLAATTDLPGVEFLRAEVDRAGASGWAALVVGLGLVLLAPVPRSAVTVLVGVVAGFGAGLAVALAGAMLGAVLAFGLSRALGRPAATRLAGPRLEQLDRQLTDRGFAAVLVGRLVPVVPFVLLSYGAGLLGVRFAPYALATAIGLVPSTVVQVGVGASAGWAAAQGAATTASLVAAVVVLAGVGLVAWRRRRAGHPAAHPEPEPVIV